MLQRQICQELGVQSQFDPKLVASARIEFLLNILRNTKAQSLVVGISGGVDSLVAGYLAQHACSQARSQGLTASFVALRLPYGVQADAADAAACIRLIKPDVALDINIKPGADALLAAIKAAGQDFNNAAQQDFIHGNIKARARMLSQYAVAAAHTGLVVGTDNAAETLMGFSTKYGDNAADIMPLSGLNKRQVRTLAAYFGAPDNLVYKVPTADLESLSPQKPDEESLGVSYDNIDDFLEGKMIDKQVYDTIIAAWHNSAHKRSLPVTPS